MRGLFFFDFFSVGRSHTIIYISNGILPNVKEILFCITGEIPPPSDLVSRVSKSLGPQSGSSIKERTPCGAGRGKARVVEGHPPAR